MNIGRWNILKIDRFTPPGAFLLDEEGNDVLLPNKYVLDEYKEEDELNVFIYKDSEDRIVATTRVPLIQLNQFAYLNVLEVNVHGAFLDWGLEKDLLVPFREQPKDMVEDRKYLVYMYLDEATQRLAATARVMPFYESATGELEKNAAVELLICETTDLGLKVIVNNKYRGLIFHSDVHRKFRLGERTVGYVKTVREDGKLDILLHPEGYDKVEPLTRKLMQLMVENDGFIALTDKSDPADIQKLTGWSKKTFKQVVGNLYKQRLIVIHENGMALIEEDDMPESE
jgi:predicted RNA-binding protein (virulence factor B family)